MTTAVLWTLVSPNNRRLGNGKGPFTSYAHCLAAVQRLRDGLDRLELLSVPAETNGQWTWRADLDGVTVAASGRSYLRVRECQYNLERFLAAVPAAAVIAGTRLARGGRGRTRPVAELELTRVVHPSSTRGAIGTTVHVADTGR